MNKMMDDGLIIRDQENLEFGLRSFLIGAKNYREDNTQPDTREDRRLAMRSLVRKLYTKMTGLDPDLKEHNFKKHFIEEIVAGDGDKY